ncbi:MAG: hypothetical protein MJ048_05355 [Acidaminococcaceae bacterium]|nr:hypothetical protein [Acidaminococcaceae bacterium]MDO4935096.1 hypothetical protein [Phascolarctobacterium sp.]
MPITTENLIIGAGPAGITAGIILHKASRDALVLERLDLQTKDKLCGGILIPMVLQELETIFQTNLHHLIVQDNVNINVINSEGQTVHPFDLGNLYTVNRHDFDLCLATMYIEQGGNLLDNILIKNIDLENRILQCFDTKNKEELTIHFSKLIAADGASSPTRYLLTKTATRVIPSLETYVNNSYSEKFLMKLSEDLQGYAWYIPQGKIANIGCVYYDNQELITKEILEEHLFSFADSLGIKIQNYRAATIPCGNDIYLQKKDCYFIGDAAGLIDPISCGGIQSSVYSAKLLTECLLQNQNYSQTILPFVMEQLNNYKSRIKYMKEINRY